MFGINKIVKLDIDNNNKSVIGTLVLLDNKGNNTSESFTTVIRGSNQINNKNELYRKQKKV